MMIAIVERMQPPAPVDADGFAPWRRALRRLNASFDRGVVPRSEALSVLAANVPPAQREEAIEDLAAALVWRSWQLGPGFGAADAWRALGPVCPARPPAALFLEEFLARHQVPHGDAPEPGEFLRGCQGVDGLAGGIDAHRCGGGRYVLTALRGAGATSQVWEARDRATGMAVALKRLQPHAAAQPEFRRRFEYEFRTAERLSHRRIVPVWDFCGDEPAPCFTMPLLQGMSLAERIEARHRPGPDQTPGDLDARTVAMVEWLAQVCEGVAHAHSCGVCHRDLKPANIFTGDDGTARILDWGFASGCGDRPGVFAGTPEYMAPEQATGHPCPASDVFSLGCILSAILTGEAPPRAGDGRRLPGGTVPRERCSSLARLCRSAMLHDPAARPAPQEMSEWLWQWTASRRSSRWRTTWRRLVGRG